MAKGKDTFICEFDLDHIMLKLFVYYVCKPIEELWSTSFSNPQWVGELCLWCSTYDHVVVGTTKPSWIYDFQLL
jgi:hypothetical protein